MGGGRCHGFDVVISVEVETRPAGIISVLINDEAGILRGCLSWLMLRSTVVGLGRDHFQPPCGHRLDCVSKVADLDTDLIKKGW